MNSQKQKEWLKKIERKIEKKNYETLKRNDNFKLFYKELQNYFLHHSLPCQLQLLKGEQFFTFELNIKCSEYSIRIYDPKLCNITIIPHPIGIELYRLEVYETGKGLGTIFMNAFNEASVKTGIVMYLMPGIPGFTSGDNNNRKRLKFYQKFNFKQASLSNYWTNKELLKNK